MTSKRGRPSKHGDSPIGILWRKTERSKPQIKVLHSKTIDEVLENGIIGIPKNAIIERIVVGQRLIDDLIK